MKMKETDSFGEVVELSLRFHRSGAGGYEISADAGPLGQGSWRFGPEAEYFSEAVRGFRQGVVSRRVLRAFGEDIFNAVVPPEDSGLYRGCEARADDEGAILRVRFDFGRAPELARLPWEYLYDSAGPGYIFTSAYRSLVRSSRIRERPLPRIELPLRILLVAHAPEKLAPIDLEREVATIERALSPLIDKRAVRLERLEPPSLRELMKRLRTGEYHVIHYVGHGSYDAQLGDGLLFFQPDSGSEDPISPGLPPGMTLGRDLGLLLGDEKSLRLVFLNACSGAESGDDYYSGSAQSIVQAGVPAVIAMQALITDRSAIALSEEFYGALADGYPVDAALSRGRKAITTRSARGLEWGVPALFTSVRDGRILGLRLSSDERSAEEEPRNPAPEPSQVDRRSAADSGTEEIATSEEETLEEPEEEAEESAESEADGPERSGVWMAATHLDRRDWRSVKIGDPVSFEPARERAARHWREAAEGDIVLLFLSGSVQGLVGWGELVDSNARPPESRRLAIAVRQILDRPVPFDELKRLVPNLRYVKHRGKFTPVSLEEWSAIRQEIERDHPGITLPPLNPRRSRAAKPRPVDGGDEIRDETTTVASELEPPERSIEAEPSPPSPVVQEPEPPRPAEPPPDAPGTPDAKGATTLRDRPPEEAPAPGTPRTERIVEVHRTVVTHVLQGLRESLEEHGRMVESTTLDIHVRPSLSEAVRKVDPGSPVAAPGDETPYSVLLTLHRFDAQGARARRFFNGPLKLRAAELPRRGDGRGNAVYGEALFEALFHDDPPARDEQIVDGPPGQATLAAGYQQARGLGGESLRVQLRIDHAIPDLHDQAWEYLWDSKSGLPEPIACSPETPFARVLHVSGSGDVASPTIRAERKLRVLVARSSPPLLEDSSRWFEPGYPLAGLQPIERSDLDTLVESLERLDLLELGHPGDGAASVTLGQLERSLQDASDRDRPYDVVHLLCHGVVDENGRGCLVMDHDFGGDYPLVDEEIVSRRLDGHGVRLVVLASCHTGKALGGRALRGVARKLVETGMPAVVAMQETLQVESASAFAERMYRHLLSSGEIDRAVNAGRLELRHLGRGSAGAGRIRADEWGIPVLFTRFPNGRLFRLAQDAKKSVDPDAPIPVRSRSQAGNADPDRHIQRAFEGAGAALGLDARTLAVLRESPAGRGSVPDETERAEATEPRGLFSRAGQERLRASLLAAAARHRRHPTRRSVLFLRRYVERPIRRVAARLREPGVAELSRKQRQDLRTELAGSLEPGGGIRLGGRESSLGGACFRLEGAGIPATVLGFRDAARGYRGSVREGQRLDLSEAERLARIDGNPWWPAERVTAPDPSDGTLKELRALLDPEADRATRAARAEALIADPKQPEAAFVSVLLSAADRDHFAPYEPELGRAVLGFRLLGGNGTDALRDARPGRADPYADDYRGFNELVFDLLHDPETGFEDAADVVLFLQRLVAEGSEILTRSVAVGEGRGDLGLRDVELDPDLLDTELVVPRRALEQAMAALEAEKHIILTGPPGTGKTSLAEDLCRLAADTGSSRGHVLATATSDWTTFDTIGGYMPGRDRRLHFRPGVFLSAVREGRWLVIDEINRADIDKAFGELFTALSGQGVTLPYRDGGRPVRILPRGSRGTGHPSEYAIPRSWRIIATMNVYDRASLFAMSKAFMRRFAFVEVDVPEPETYARLIGDLLKRNELGGLKEDVRKCLLGLFRRDDPGNGGEKGNPLMRWRSLGPAIALDVVRYLRRCREGSGDLERGHVADALSLYVVPQLDDLGQAQVESVLRYLQGEFPGERYLEQRIRALFPYFTLDVDRGRGED